jgi:dihydrofolate synthase/folylpolyglutamate synthase
MDKPSVHKIQVEPLDSYLESFINYERYKYFPKKVNLDEYKKFLTKVKNPHRKLSPSILVAGTNGKGSVAALLSSILSSSGYRIGLYTSPHLFSYRERIRIDGTPISKQDFSECIKSLTVVLEEPYEKERRTFFEVLTTVAFVHFARRKTDLNILEVGLGGRKDSTNVVDPVLSVLTSIGFDHTRSLGTTLSAIAREKCGIIRENGIVVTSRQHRNAMRTIEEIADEQNATLYKTEEMDGFKIQTVDREGLSFFYGKGEYFVPLPGRFQTTNLKTTLLAVDLLPKEGFRVTDAALKRGLRSFSWRGRFDKISEDPLIILDGAHNPPAMREVMKAVGELYPQKKIITIFSCLSSKDRKGMARYIEKTSQTVIVTEIDAVRATKLCDLKRVFSRKVIMRSTIQDALAYARERADENTLILITGSIYLVAEAYGALTQVLN